MATAASPHAHNTLARKVANVRVCVPDTDWARVLAGDKRMFRSYSRRRQPVLLPSPAVAWRYHPGHPDGLQSALIFLEGTWREPLGAITPGDLAAEGFSSLSDFRRYIEVRYPDCGYRPLQEVQVYRVRPITEEDLEDCGHRLVDHLYRRWLR